MQSSPRPNVLLVVIDSLRSDHVSSYGYSRKTTPNIDNIATDALLLEEAISPSGWTPPVFSSIMTGTYPSRNGAGRYAPELPTIMDILHSCGYKTFGVTLSFFLASISTGFDEFAYLDRNSIKKILSKDRMAVLRFAALVLRQRTIRNYESLASGFMLNRVAKRWIERNYNKGPFFALVHHSAHWPYAPPEPFLSRFLDDSQKARIGDVKRDVYELISEQSLDQKLDVINGLYDGQIAKADACVGELIEHLKSLGIFDDTIVVITSDHGDLLGEHGLLFHEFVLYEPLIRIPFLMRFPNQYQKGKRYTGLVQTLDILPTLVDYLGIPYSNMTQNIQGKSLLKLVENTDTREFTISERSDWDQKGVKARKLAELERAYPTFDWRKYTQEIVAIRTKEFKHIWSSKSSDELYDLLHDPGEACNLISVEKERATELKNKMDGWKRSFAPAMQTTVEIELDRYVKEKLRKLGYL